MWSKTVFPFLGHCLEIAHFEENAIECSLRPDLELTEVRWKGCNFQVKKDQYCVPCK